MRQNFSMLTKIAFGSIRNSSAKAALAACAMAFLLPIPSAQSLEPKWPAGPYRYLVVDQDLRDILKEFGHNLNIGVRISDQVVARRVRGRLPVTSAKEFLNQLCTSYGLVWYYDGSKLHITSENEMRTETLSLGRLQQADLRDALQKLERTDPRYPVRSTGGDSTIVSISGPPRYIEQVQETIKALQVPPAPKPGAKAQERVEETQDGDFKAVRVFRGNRDGS
jgi:type II secretory pathway component GspD/PulD (secretin)